MYPNDNEYGADPWAGKRAGETYDEAKKRQDEDARRIQEEIRKAQEQENFRLKEKELQKRDVQPEIPRVNTSNERRTVFAEWVSRLGILLLAMGGLLWGLHFVFQSIKVSWAVELIKAGVICLILVLAYKWVFYILLAAAFTIFLLAGSQSAGGSFDVNTVPLEGYLATLGMLALAFVYRWIFAPKEE